ncbi:hypothetical protein GCM10027192_05980 [Psychrobacter pocilloporae]
MIQPVESFKWINAMKISTNIEIKVNVAAVITAISGLILTIAMIYFNL